MPTSYQTDLSTLFQSALDCLLEKRQELNQADGFNGNHGDHMVEIFQVAVVAAQHGKDSDLASAMENASLALKKLPQNGSARLYARGLEQFASQFRRHGVSLGDLLAYGQNLLRESKESAERSTSSQNQSGAVLKALVSGLTGWSQAESEQGGRAHLLSLGALFELGMAYLQAKQRGGSKAEILADAAATASPLSAQPHRYQSGKLAIQSILQAMEAAS